jgi:hypothetical protein
MNTVFVILEVKTSDHGDFGFTNIIGVRFSTEDDVKKEVETLNQKFHSTWYYPQDRCSYQYKRVTTEGYQDLRFPSEDLNLQEIAFKNGLYWEISNKYWNYQREGIDEDIKNMTFEDYFFRNYSNVDSNILPIERAKELFHEEIDLNGIAPFT